MGVEKSVKMVEEKNTMVISGLIKSDFPLKCYYRLLYPKKPLVNVCLSAKSLLKGIREC